MFHLYAEQGVDFALAGEIDLSCAQLFGATLERMMDLSAGPELVVDMRGLTFIDHLRLLVLAELARSAGHTLVLHTGISGPVARVIKLLGLPDLADVRVVVTQ